MTYGVEGVLNIIDVDASSFTISNEPIGTVFYINAAQATTVNLPPLSSVTEGTHYILKRNGGAYNVTMDPNSNETIDGNITKSISGTWDSWRIISTSSGWITIGYGLS